MEKKKVVKKSAKSRSDDRKFNAFIASFFMIIGFIVAAILWKKDKYVMFYAKEGLVLFIAFIVTAVLNIVPFIGEVLQVICFVIVLVLWVFTWLYALQGERKKTWVIGDLAEKIDF